MATLVAYIVATVLFLVAWLQGGVHVSWADFVALGLALVALGLALATAGFWPVPRPPARQ